LQPAVFHAYAGSVDNSIDKRAPQLESIDLLESFANIDRIPEFETGERPMPLVTVVLTLVVVGVLLWLVNRFIPMQSQIKGILNGVVVIAVVLWLLKIFNLFDYLTQFKVGH
jgi:hypothetical protein